VGPYLAPRQYSVEQDVQDKKTCTDHGITIDLQRSRQSTWLVECSQRLVQVLSYLQRRSFVREPKIGISAYRRRPLDCPEAVVRCLVRTRHLTRLGKCHESREPEVRLICKPIRSCCDMVEPRALKHTGRQIAVIVLRPKRERWQRD
jgi:hypothetical protein